MRGIFLSTLLLAAVQSATVIAVPAQTQHPAARKPVAKRKPVPRFDPTEGDHIEGDDLTIRRAAVEALGNQNGSVVVVDPNTGRILTMVNQKLALKSGFTPCSTIKLVTALAALTERVVDRETFISLRRSVSYNMTTALARSNNPYFSELGKRLGFERVTHYAQMLGIGEKAGLDIPGEQPGSMVEQEPKYGGVGMMTAYGEGFLLTPLELAAMLSAIANNGTLYYLQYPQSQAEIDELSPKIKRQLELAPNGIADIKMGMRGAVDYGTAHRASYDPNEPILGKTGTCTDFRAGSHMGWFGSFNDVGRHQLVVVVMLTSPTKSVNGGVASGVAGALYHNLSEQRYFAADFNSPVKKTDLPEILTCCSHH